MVIDQGVTQDKHRPLTGCGSKPPDPYRQRDHVEVALPAGRGSKLLSFRLALDGEHVALLAGAWVETIRQLRRSPKGTRRPPVSPLIEEVILKPFQKGCRSILANRVIGHSSCSDPLSVRA